MPLFKKHLQLFLLVVLVTLAVFFRFYQIREYVVFLGDEGRDMIVMRDIFKNHDLPFLGPTASVGGFYLGPIYYWMAAPFLLLSGFDPVGPSYMIALFGVATVILMYKFLKDSVGFWPAFLASTLYATSPLIVRYSRSSWNPNPMPFFALLLLFCIYSAIKNKSFILYLAAGACFGVAIQLHYLGLILAPLTAAIIITNERFKRIPFAIPILALGSLITFFPFLAFEIKNNFPNLRTVMEFVTRGSTIGYTGNILWTVADIANIFLNCLTKIEGTPFTRLYFWIASMVVLSALISKWESKSKLIFSLGFIYFVGGIFFLRLYAGHLNDYYFGIIFPAPFIIFALFTSVLWQKKLSRLAIAILFIVVFSLFISKGFYTGKPNNLIEQTKNITNIVIEKTQGKPYNFALISDSNSDHAYRYFLEIKNHAPTKLEDLVTSQLIVICESQKCAPLGNPLWEIAGFGRGEIQEVWNLPQYNFKVFKLIHWPGEPSPAGKPAIKGI